MNPYFIEAIYVLYPQAVRTVGTQAYDANGNLVEYDAAAVQVKANKMSCKEQAKALLSASDWSVLSDVGLQNAADFVAYRSTLRNLVISPVETPVFPTEPNPVWSN